MTRGINPKKPTRDQAIAEANLERKRHDIAQTALTILGRGEAPDAEETCEADGWSYRLALYRSLQAHGGILIVLGCPAEDQLNSAKLQGIDVTPWIFDDFRSERDRCIRLGGDALPLAIAYDRLDQARHSLWQLPRYSEITK